MRRGHGFTLIEILIVISIIALAMTVAVASLGNRDDSARLEREGRRLQLTIELARERAERDAVEWGLDLSEDHYRFMRYDEANKKWVPLTESPFNNYQLDAAVKVDLYLETAKLPSEGKGDTDRPDLLLLSSGEAQAFNLVVVAKENSNENAPVRWLLSCDGFNPAQLRRLEPNEAISNSTSAKPGGAESKQVTQ